MDKDADNRNDPAQGKPLDFGMPARAPDKERNDCHVENSTDEKPEPDEPQFGQILEMIVVCMNEDDRPLVPGSQVRIQCTEGAEPSPEKRIVSERPHRIDPVGRPLILEELVERKPLEHSVGPDIWGEKDKDGK